MEERKIIHVDMDAFYAAVEMRDHPEWRNLPLVVGRNPRQTGGRGVVATANYHARRYGIHSAMSTQKAWELCPHAVFKQPDFAKYKQVSQQIHTIFHEYTDIVEYVAFDEAYLDVTQNKKQLESAVAVAAAIRNDIKQVTGLNCSLARSYNKFMAKLASDYCKPAGNTVIDATDALAFLFPLPIAAFRGVGKKTLPKMLALNIQNGADLYQWKQADLIKEFGKFGYVLYERARGIDRRPVAATAQRKSVSSERTFDQPLTTRIEVTTELTKLAQRVTRELARHHLHGKTIVLKVRNSDYETFTKRITLADYGATEVGELVEEGQKLFDAIQATVIDVRLLGIGVTTLESIDYKDINLDLKL